jgi:flagellar biosynthetic protein FlhB
VSAGGDKTEKATPKRRDEARKKGQVARSIEVNSALVLIATFTVLALMAPSLFARLRDVVSRGLAQSGDTKLVTVDGLPTLGMWAMKETALAIAPVVGAALAAGLLASVAQVGFKITPTALKPSLTKLNPLPGFKRIFGKDGLVEGAKAVLKTGVVALVAFMAIWPRLPDFAALVGLPPAELLSELSHTILGIAIRVVAVLAVIALLDFVYQRRRHEKQLKMTKDEVKQEAKQSDVAPEVRGAIRRRQMEQARKRMLAEVPSADVVVVNPTHFAVALRYDGSKPAPEVVAKGVDLVAAAIRRAAEESGVSIVHDAPLARTLYREVELGAMIPEGLFAAVAEVLAFVYRTAGRRGNRGLRRLARERALPAGAGA